MAHYATAQAVIARTGVQPEDLGQVDDETLTTFLEGLLAEASDLVNRKLRRDYLADLAAGSITEIPPGLVGIVADVVADAIRTMVATRQTPVVRIDDFAVTTLRARFFSEDVERRLKLYRKGGGLVSVPIETPYTSAVSSDWEAAIEAE